MKAVLFFLLFFGVQGYQTGIDKISFGESKVETFTVKEKSDNVLYYSYPAEFGKLLHIYRIPEPGLKMPIRDFITDWSISYITIDNASYIVYTRTIHAENKFEIKYEFTFN